MRTSKFTPEQMVAVLRMGDSGVPVVELCPATWHQRADLLPVAKAIRRCRDRGGARAPATPRGESEAQAGGGGSHARQADPEGGALKKGGEAGPLAGTRRMDAAGVSAAPAPGPPRAPPRVSFATLLCDSCRGPGRAAHVPSGVQQPATAQQLGTADAGRIPRRLGQQRGPRRAS